MRSIVGAFLVSLVVVALIALLAELITRPDALFAGVPR